MGIKYAWEKQRLEYQVRYFKACEIYEGIDDKQAEYKEYCRGHMLEMSWVLHRIFGLNDLQVGEVERNRGLTQADSDSDEIMEIFSQIKAFF